MRAHVRRSVVWLHHEADLLESVSATPTVDFPVRPTSKQPGAVDQKP
jgi:hypothetical protein